MESIEKRALKSSFLSQMGVKTNSQAFYNDDLWCLADINGVSSDDFPVEDLLNLDFSEKELHEGVDEKKATQETISNDFSSIFSGSDEFDSFTAGELAVPVEDLENLEWLSQFVDDSASGFSLTCPAGSFSVKTGASTASNRVDSLSKPGKKTRTSCFSKAVSKRPRSKRSRENGRPWSLSSPALSSDESSSASSCSSSSATTSPRLFPNPVHDPEPLSAGEKPTKKQRVKPEAAGSFVSGRRCTHCLVQKTPQWRAGPLGPKTLCNACGVRFKSGRLFPEYRPACSPTFMEEVHSNSHRKVLEMRRRKDVDADAEAELTVSVSG